MRMFHVKHEDLLLKALEIIGFEDKEKVIGQFRRYESLLIQWNQRMNLISHSDEKRIVSRHFIESIGLISAIKFPLRTRVADLGSGAGFPGIPLKLVRPDLDMILVESVRKKILFLRQILEELELPDIQVIQGRMEVLARELFPLDFVVSRAVGDLATLTQWSLPALADSKGKLVVLKGGDIQSELDDLKRQFDYKRILTPEIRYYSPFSSLLPDRRCFIVVIKKN
jgi:16S rRNA (guanine527-N7)-methyltransferase